jgi:predicted nuclease with TOPRIM domain
MLSDKDIRDIQGYLKGLLPPHREERFKERLNNEPELKSKFDELNPMLKAIEEINFEHKIREIITKKVPDYEPVMQEMITPQKVVPSYKRMWVYVAAACVLVFSVVGIDYFKNKKLREELLVLQQKEKARQDSLKAVYAQERQLKDKKDSINYYELQSHINSPNDKLITDKNTPKNPDKEFVKVPKNKEIKPKNNLDDIPEISSLKGAKSFSRIITIIYQNQKTQKLSEIKEGKVTVKFSNKDFGDSEKVGTVVFIEQTNSFILSITDTEIFTLLRKKDFSITQKSNDIFMIDLGSLSLGLNVKSRTVKIY